MSSTKFIVPTSVRPFVFSLLVVSSLSVKGLHLGRHVRSLSPRNWIALLPFVFFQDVALAIIGRLLLARGTKRWKIFDAGLLGFILTQAHPDISLFCMAADGTTEQSPRSQLPWKLRSTGRRVRR